MKTHEILNEDINKALKINLRQLFCSVNPGTLLVLLK